MCAEQENPMVELWVILPQICFLFYPFGKYFLNILFF